MLRSPRSFLLSLPWASFPLRQLSLSYKVSFFVLETMPSRPASVALRQQRLDILEWLGVTHIGMIKPTQQYAELLLSGDERQQPRVHAVERHQVEAPNAGSSGCRCRNGAPRNLWGAVFPAGRRLAIDDRALAR